MDGEPDPPTTTEDLDGGEWVVWIRDSIAHRSVLLQPRDAWGNACRTSAAHVTAQLQRVRDGVVSTAPGVVEVCDARCMQAVRTCKRVTGHECRDIQVEPLDSGCVRVVYGVDQPGRYFLTVRMSGTVLPGCPMKFAAKYHPSEVARREIAERNAAAELARAQEEAEKLRQEEARRVEAGTSGDACLEEAEALLLLEEQQRRQREALQAQQEVCGSQWSPFPSCNLTCALVLGSETRGTARPRRGGATSRGERAATQGESARYSPDARLHHAQPTLTNPLRTLVAAPSPSRQLDATKQLNSHAPLLQPRVVG